MYDVIKTLRRSPFGEWNVVYFDARKTAPGTLQARLRGNGCRAATLVVAKPQKAGAARVWSTSPIVVAGDLVQVAVQLPPKGTGHATLAVPKGWTLPHGARRDVVGTTYLLAQTPRSAKQGTHRLTVALTANGQTTPLTLSVELVQQVR